MPSAPPSSFAPPAHGACGAARRGATRKVAGAAVVLRIGGCRAAARVVAHWHREEDWPPAFLAPYQLRLAGVAADEDALLFAPVDSDSFVRPVGKTVLPVGWDDPALLLGYCDWDGRSAREWRRSGMSGLHFSCMRGDAHCVAQLLRRPLAENTPSAAENPFRDSLLHACVQAESLECAMLLLAAGADPTVRNASGRSPLELAVEHVGGLRCEWTHGALVQLLSRFLEVVDGGDGGQPPPEAEQAAPGEQLYL